MELAEWLNENLGKKIVLFDTDGRRYEGIIQRVFSDFFQIFETKKGLNKVFRFSAIKDFSLEESEK